MDLQLKWIINSLEKHKIDYFLNDGTLLGIKRDGKLIEWDPDIDIGIFEKDIDKMKNVLKEGKKRRHKIDIKKYGGVIWGYELSKINYLNNLFYPYLFKIDGNRKIDVSIFREKLGFYWKPIPFSKWPDKKSCLSYFYKFIKGLNKKGLQN